METGKLLKLLRCHVWIRRIQLLIISISGQKRKVSGVLIVAAAGTRQKKVNAYSFSSWKREMEYISVIKTAMYLKRSRGIMDRKKILEKIKKCLALSKSANEHEAAAALQKARELMEEYKVTDAEVLTADIQTDKIKASAGKPNIWETSLADIVAEAFSCRVIFHSRYNERWELEGNWEFIGLNISPELAKFAFDVLLRQLKRERTAYIKAKLSRCKRSNKTVRADMFCIGWVASVRALVRKFAKYDPPKAIEAYVNEKYPALSTVKVKSRQGSGSAKTRSGDDYFNGRVKGKDANLNHGVSGSSVKSIK
jgi:hypothetical protein